MTQLEFKTYRKYLSFEKDIANIEKDIIDMPKQTRDGSSEIGYMSEELREFKRDMLNVIDKYKNKIELLKEEL